MTNQTSAQTKTGSGSSSLNATYVPPPINRVEDTGLSPLWLQDLILKVLYFQGYLTGFRVAEEVALPYAGVTDHLLEELKRDKQVEVRGSQMGLGEGAYQYAITGAGIVRAREALERSQYAGPAPVTLEIYNAAQRRQSRGHVMVTSRTMRQVLGTLISFGKNISPYRSSSQFGYVDFHLRSAWEWQDQYRAIDWQFNRKPAAVHSLCPVCRWTGHQAV